MENGRRVFYLGFLPSTFLSKVRMELDHKAFAATAQLAWCGCAVLAHSLFFLLFASCAFSQDFKIVPMSQVNRN